MFKQLLGNKLLVEKEEEKKPEEKRTESGLYIPPTQNQQQQSLHGQGKVVQVGPECEVVQKGETVMYDKMAIRPIEIDDTEYVLLNEESVVGVL